MLSTTAMFTSGIVLRPGHRGHTPLAVVVDGDTEGSEQCPPECHDLGRVDGHPSEGVGALEVVEGRAVQSRTPKVCLGELGRPAR